MTMLTVPSEATHQMTIMSRERLNHLHIIMSRLITAEVTIQIVSATHPTTIASRTIEQVEAPTNIARETEIAFVNAELDLN